MNIIRRPDTSRRRIAAIGMYDGVHTGHRFLIDHLRRQAERLNLVPSVVTFSRHPRSVVAPVKPVAALSALSDKLTLLEQAGVDDCILMDFSPEISRLSAEEFLRDLHDDYGIDALVMGFNNHFGHDRNKNFEQYSAIGKRLGITVLRAPEFSPEGCHISSSEVRHLLWEGKMEEANAALGYHWTMHATVTHGKNLGRTLGYPTANLVPLNPETIVPMPGVYAANVVTPDGVSHRAVVNIGHRPTVDGPDADITIEAHIIDYDGWLYDEQLTVEFLRHLRREKEFPTLDALKRAIKADVVAAKAI